MAGGRGGELRLMGQESEISEPTSPTASLHPADTTDTTRLLSQRKRVGQRLENLELMQEYGPESWKAYNGSLVRLLTEAQKELAKLRHDIQQIHFERKQKQTEAGEKLKGLEASWVSLVTKNYQIEQGCAQVELEVGPLRKKFKKLQDTSEEEYDPNWNK